MRGYTITRDKFMSPGEVRTLLSVCEARSIVDTAKGRQTWVKRYMLVHLAIYSGLRVSEIAALKIGDLHINGKATCLIVQNGKGGRRREVYLDKELVRHLKSHIKTKYQAWGESVDEAAPFFLGRDGQHYTTTALQLSFKRALQEACLPERYSIHSCRHTYATILLSKTNNLRFVQKQLGHASLNMTSLYADVLPETNQALADAILG
ncbi:MAG: site-specific integrase [Desulfatibacillaceae bacterium]|nr:site-specific integrase [Desulfatibacillaceae bacterium]